jgi:endonuclease YncB( thermonuclease family)
LKRFARCLLGPGALAAVLGLAGPALADPCEAALPKQGATFAGVVRYVGDGDSLCVGPGSDPATWIEVRLADFYAPELHGPGGAAAKQTLSRIALNQRVVCRAQHRSYDRIVAACTLGGRSVGELMRRAGVTEGGAGR